MYNLFPMEGYNFNKSLILTKFICSFETSKIKPYFYKNSI